MGFQLSPGVNVSEIDLTTVVPSVLTTAGAFAGTFKWGPANQVVLVDSEITLSKTFGTPDSNSAVSFFTSANFLSYGNNLSLVRAIGSNCRNAVANTNIGIKIDNTETFQYSFLNAATNNLYGAFVARYPGALGNSLQISVCDAGSNFSNWAYSSYFTSAPGTSEVVSAAGGANDEIHIVVTDAGGLFTGTKGTVIETYPFVSKAIDASVDGVSNYYKQVIFNSSKYIYATDPVDYANTSSTWGKTISTNFATLANTQTATLSLGTDDVPSVGDLTSAYNQFSNKESIDISLVLTGNHSVTVQQAVIDNVVNSRKDCVAFISPPSTAVISNAGSETSSINAWLNSLARSSSYVVADSGWKYQFDVYNNVYRWIPLNGDIAGLCVNTDNIRDPWYSPAGFNRGAIKNAIKLAWNPSKTARDTLYAVGVNPVVSFPGQGIVLFGDKTLQNKPSAFDRINVRRLFIVLEKAIARAAQSSLFEFNDEFTRAQFVAIVTPFLRDVQGRRGITDFKVVCDTTNNTAQVIDSNQFVGDIYIKPARSINFIQLNFVAVGTGVEFTTVVGAV
jgi:hypothetical protein